MALLRRAAAVLGLFLVFASMLVGLERCADGICVVDVDPTGTGTPPNITNNKEKLLPADIA